MEVAEVAEAGGGGEDEDGEVKGEVNGEVEVKAEVEVKTEAKGEVKQKVDGEVKVESEVEVEVDLGPPLVDLRGPAIKVDHFDQMHRLGEDKVIDGAPNFRQLPGFPVFGTAQPRAGAFKSVLDRIPVESYGKKLKTFWFNTRPEPVVYLDGMPYAPRHLDRMHENLDLPSAATPAQLDRLQSDMAAAVRARMAENADGRLAVHRDSGFTDNPLDREDRQGEIEVRDVRGFPDVFSAEAGDRDVVLVRFPCSEDAAPPPSSFDALVSALRTEPAAARCVFSCQAGAGRTTAGMAAAAVVKEAQLSSGLRGASQVGLLTSEVAEALVEKRFGEKNKKKTEEEEEVKGDPLLRGEFEVIKELLKKEPSASPAKARLDRLLDLLGPAPRGVGVENLRECIVETKWKYDVAPEERQLVWRKRIINFIERYFYLICFTMYATEVGPAGFQTNFSSWLCERSHLKEMIDLGKDKLEWYRQVDPAKLATLKDLIGSPDYKQNLGALIKTIYEFAFMTYSDLPRGPIKNNSMRKLAAKTLLEILPEDLSASVQRRLAEQASASATAPATSPDFLTLVGIVSYYQ